MEKMIGLRVTVIILFLSKCFPAKYPHQLANLRGKQIVLGIGYSTGAKNGRRDDVQHTYLVLCQMPVYNPPSKNNTSSPDNPICQLLFWGPHSYHILDLFP
jgi:hypothetical protein